jgi:hypothetical protein
MSAQGFPAVMLIFSSVSGGLQTRLITEVAVDAITDITDLDSGDRRDAGCLTTG